jgi:hypothetical protein
MSTTLSLDQVTTSFGVLRIAQERQRQIAQEGFDDEHDSTHESKGQMALAAACYAASAAGKDLIYEEADPDCYRQLETCERANWPKELWPWADSWDKREKHSKIRQLEIAGALIAAELDLLHRSDA